MVRLTHLVTLNFIGDTDSTGTKIEGVVIIPIKKNMADLVLARQEEIIRSFSSDLGYQLGITVSFNELNLSTPLTASIREQAQVIQEKFTGFLAESIDE